jgi:hypothetical protein
LFPENRFYSHPDFQGMEIDFSDHMDKTRIGSIQMYFGQDKRGFLRLNIRHGIPDYGERRNRPSIPYFDPFFHLGEASGAVFLGGYVNLLASGAFQPPNRTPISQLAVKPASNLSQPPVITEPDPALVNPASRIAQFHGHSHFLLYSMDFLAPGNIDELAGLIIPVLRAQKGHHFGKIIRLFAKPQGDIPGRHLGHDLFKSFSTFSNQRGQRLH